MLEQLIYKVLNCRTRELHRAEIFLQSYNVQYVKKKKSLIELIVHQNSTSFKKQNELYIKQQMFTEHCVGSSPSTFPPRNQEVNSVAHHAGSTKPDTFHLLAVI